MKIQITWVFVFLIGLLSSVYYNRIKSDSRYLHSDGTGYITSAQIPNGSVGSSQLAGDLRFSGTTVGTFSGNGSGLTDVTAIAVRTGGIDAAQIANGAVGSSQLASDLKLSGITAGTFIGNGSGLTDVTAVAVRTGGIDAAQIANGAVGSSHLAGDLKLSGTTTLSGAVSIGGTLNANGVIRVNQAGDLSMGHFHKGPKPDGEVDPGE